MYVKYKYKSVEYGFTHGNSTPEAKVERPYLTIEVRPSVGHRNDAQVICKINVPKTAIKKVRLVDSDLLMILDENHSLFIKDGALQYASHQNFIIQFSDEKQNFLDFIHHHPDVGCIPCLTDINFLYSTPEIVLPKY